MHSGNLAVQTNKRPNPAFDPIGGGSFVEAYNRHFQVIRADTPERRDEGYRLRYQVYCLEHAFEDPSKHPDEREVDGYDSHSAHSLLIHRESGTVAGTVRLVLPSANDPLPITKICHHRSLQDRLGIAPETTAEVSRFTGEISRLANANQFRRRATDENGAGRPLIDGTAEPNSMDRRVAPHITLGLVKAVIDMSLTHGITHLCAVMEPALLRLLNRIGIFLDPVGPLVSYHGSRQPCHAPLDRILDGAKMKQPEIWALITGGKAHTPAGAICPEIRHAV
jgi:N-acyl amino acid synthase of PEP-CTERM/exosortase system